MAYSVYLDGIPLPIIPSKITTEIKGKNKTLNLINEGEVNILKSPGLIKIKFDMIIPYVKYPYAVYADGFKSPGYYIDVLERLMWGKRPFQFICSRVSPSGKLLFDTNIKVSLENYKILENAKDGQEVRLSIELKQYKNYGTKVVKVREYTGSEIKSASIKESRSIETAPKLSTYIVRKGDTLWNIAKKTLGDGSRNKEIAAINSDKVSNPNLINVGLELSLPT